MLDRVTGAQYFSRTGFVSMAVDGVFTSSDERSDGASEAAAAGAGAVGGMTGAWVGAQAVAAIGTAVGGPVGTLVGGAVGALAGGIIASELGKGFGREVSSWFWFPEVLGSDEAEEARQRWLLEWKPQSRFLNSP